MEDVIHIHFFDNIHYTKPNTLLDLSLTKDNRLLDNLVVEGWHRVREVPSSIPSQGPRHTKDVIKIDQLVPLFSTEH